MSNVTDVNKWWREPETQKLTTDLMEHAGPTKIQLMTAGLLNNEIVLKVVTLDGNPIEDFPKKVHGKKVVFGNFDILK